MGTSDSDRQLPVRPDLASSAAGTSAGTSPESHADAPDQDFAVVPATALFGPGSEIDGRRGTR